jgi:hypothetical protein
MHSLNQQQRNSQVYEDLVLTNPLNIANTTATAKYKTSNISTGLFQMGEYSVSDWNKRYIHLIILVVKCSVHFSVKEIISVEF